VTSASADRANEAPFGESLRARNLSWLIRTAGLCALGATLFGVVVVPGVQGYASDAAVEWCEHAAAVLSYAMAILAAGAIAASDTELVLTRRAESVSGALVVSGAPLVVVLLVVAITRARVIPDATFPWQLAIGTAVVASSVAATAAWRAMHGPHTRALAIAISAFTIAALVRIGAWELARAAGERGSPELGAVSRVVVTLGVLLEAAAQAVVVAWIGSRGRLGMVLSSLAALVAFAVTWGAASGAHVDAPAWASALHAALAEPSALPAPYALSAAQSFLSASAILLAAAALALRAQPAAITSAFALALVSRGVFDVPLRAIAIVAAAMWAFCSAFDERLLWAAHAASPRHSSRASNPSSPSPSRSSTPPNSVNPR
jgi:hypothetical protein